jgi:hypothetical protein
VTPSQIYAWQGLGPDVELTSTTERMPSEQKWYALTGRVVDAKVEADGDIHLALQDATGNGVGTVSAEISFHTSSAKKLTLNQTPVITVTGKASKRRSPFVLRDKMADS